jgi:hypothetical protein
LCGQTALENAAPAGQVQARGDGACRKLPAGFQAMSAPPQGLPASFAEQAGHERGGGQELWANMGPCPIPHIKIRKTGAGHMACFQRLQEALQKAPGKGIASLSALPG